jgi:squalene-hopene/tetraprenyl-beta-curcumene cyclase
MTHRSLVLALSLVAAGVAVPARAADDLDPALRAKAEHAVDAGLAYLRKHQADDGSWSKSVGVTAIAVRGFLESHGHPSEAEVAKPVAFILEHAQKNGSIGESKENVAYNTATALVALQATRNPRYAATIRKAQQYLAGIQIDEGEGRKPGDPQYGGIGYSDDDRPDLSNQYMALEALRATSFDPKSPVWEKALKFVSRCQNRSESNDQSWATNDGGFTYTPGFSPYGGTGSYGGMTHAGLLSLLFAGVDKKDPRVQAAYDWIRAHYTLDENPGVKDRSGLYYYYTAFAQSMAAFGAPTVKTPDGTEHRWRDELVRKIVSLQDAREGSWVNADSPRWWEGDKNLTTARMVVALNLATR